MSNAIRSWRRTAGARNAKRERMMAVRHRRGARYKVTALERPAIMMKMNVEIEYRKDVK